LLLSKNRRQSGNCAGNDGSVGFGNYFREHYISGNGGNDRNEFCNFFCYSGRDSNRDSSTGDDNYNRSADDYYRPADDYYRPDDDYYRRAAYDNYRRADNDDRPAYDYNCASDNYDRAPDDDSSGNDNSKTRTAEFLLR
jgi:hypothetical protein